MVDELRNIKDSVIATVIGAISNAAEAASSGGLKLDLKGAKDLIGTIATIAGKGKDEIVQMICREIGIAVAALIKEPLTKLLENKKLQVTLELVQDEKTKTKRTGSSTKRK